MKIFCCNCDKEVEARLTNGKEIYPHRKDLYKLPFWRCECGDFVGCHHKSKDSTKPLGVIPTHYMRKLRSNIHRQIDPIWKSGKRSRKDVYRILSDKLGHEFHTAETRSVKECKKILGVIIDLKAKEWKVEQ